MDGAQQVVVCPLTEDLIQDVVGIHRGGLGYTVNSRLGSAHLAFLYREMARDPTSYVGVAMVDGRPAGIVSGTLDEDTLKSNLLKSMSGPTLAGLATRLLLRPWLILQWLQSVIIALPVYHQRQEVIAVLTALAVDPGFQGRGVGRKLVGALEEFFGANKVGKYRLDTLGTNQRALKFYSDLGFTEVARRTDSVILVRTIGQ
jgi:GNAT superfamily N-acetyltransferase